MDEIDDCLLCDEPVVDEDLGFCVRCYWATRAELEAGWGQLGRYLRNWADFRDWELSQPAGGSPLSHAPRPA